jgi:NAD(P)H-hydrate epimerase
MPPRPLTRDEVRAIDRRAIDEYGVPGVVLMENAGHGVARVLARQGIRGPVVICCGKGNNGGDGYVIARHLDAWGHDVAIVLACDPSEVTGDAAAHLAILQKSALRCLEPDPTLQSDGVTALLRSADWVVDGLLGTGLHGPVREPMRTAIDTLNALSPATRRLAIDIPSGLDCDTGEPLGAAVRADVTVTFVAWKAGFAKPAAAPFLGAVHVVDIGVPRAALRGFE